MAAISRILASRKRRSCDTKSVKCVRTIEPGQQYRRSSLTPNDPEISNIGWWHANECSACAALYGRPFPEVVEIPAVS